MRTKDPELMHSVLASQNFGGKNFVKECLNYDVTA